MYLVGKFICITIGVIEYHGLVLITVEKSFTGFGSVCAKRWMKRTPRANL